MSKSELGQNLRNFRIGLGLSKRQISIGLRCNYNTYCGWENDGKLPPFSIFARLKERYGADLNAIFQCSDPWREDYEKVRESQKVVTQIKHIPPRGNIAQSC